MAKQYFIFFNPQAKNTILKNGLIVHRERAVLMSDNKAALELFATNKLGLSQYSLYEISETGVENMNLTDNISVMGSSSLYLLEKGYINPAFVKHLHDVIDSGKN